MNIIRKHLVRYSIVTLLLASCSSLSVKVDIMDRDKLKAMPGVVEGEVEGKAFQVIAQLQDGSYEKIKSNLKNDYMAGIETALARHYISDNIAPTFINDMFQYIDRTFNDAMTSYRKGLEFVTKARADVSPENTTILFVTAKSNFEQGDIILRDLTYLVRSDIADLASKSLAQDDLNSFVNSTGINSTIKHVTSLTKDAGLLNDPLASAIVGAPEEYWKEKYNDTYAHTCIGNSDIAIAMEDLGHFTIKGVRLDASQIANTSRKVVTQAISIFASAYGIPIPVTTGSTGGKEEAKQFTLGDEYSVEVNKIELKAKQQLSKEASIAIIDSILSQRNNLSATKSREQAIKTVKQTFTAYKSQLNPSLAKE